MLRLKEDFQVESNFWAALVLPKTRRVVKSSIREGHNVFTTVGRDWLSRLVVWNVIGSPDQPVTSRRLRWMGVGTGTQLEVEGVTSLVAPVLVDQSGHYIAALQTYDFPATGRVRVYKEFSTGEISTPGNPVVAVTEAGLFVDVFPVSTLGGSDDSAIGGENTTLNRSTQFNAPVAYHTFNAINKTADFNLLIRWELRFT